MTRAELEHQAVAERKSVEARLAEFHSLVGAPGVREIVDVFKKSSAEALPRLPVASEARNFEDLHQVAHDTIGMVANVGARKLEGTLRTCISASSSGDWTRATELVQSALSQYQTVLALLEEITSEMERAETEGRSPGSSV